MNIFYGFFVLLHQEIQISGINCSGVNNIGVVEPMSEFIRF